ncbi:MAG: bacillithiol system redox-active protein YtxJ [Cyclobacteriaceae bacterium]|nr:bacillithiol system redox-active protein YtxJ [Cyclobacteriaceae bacterium]
MEWQKLESVDQIEKIKDESKTNQVLIFKHSTSCSISRAVLDRLERNWNTDQMSGVVPYYLDLLKFREVSNQVAKAFSIEHESPQVMLIEMGRDVYHTSHFDISYQNLVAARKEKTDS